MAKIVSRQEWLAARKAFLVKEKEFTHLRDELTRARRELPMEPVDTEYSFDGENGKETLAELFGPHSQLIVYHFMFDPDWDAGCPHCSFWADNFNNIPIHLAHRDIAFVAISRAPYPKLEAYRARMGWSFKWLSSYANSFNFDYRASFTPEQVEKKEMIHNFDTQPVHGPETTGVSVFYKVGRDVFRTYSAYSRGVDMLNAAYHYMDLTPKGRNEQKPHPQSWVRRHDEYND